MTVSSSKGLRISEVQLRSAIEQLRKLVAIPSLSNPHNADYEIKHLLHAADFVGDQLRELGLEVEFVSIDGSAPFILAQKGSDPKKPTILCYAHYDVQPVMRDQWDSDPFSLTEKNGRLYGRGSGDDKGGIIAILAALEVYQKARCDFPCNIRVLFEGEEEYGSSHMAELIHQEQKRLHADALIVMDGGNKTIDSGSLTTSVRGLLNFKLQVKTMARPIHSGIGCLAPDPSLILAQLMVSLKNPRTIPGFMSGCTSLQPMERELLAKGSRTAKEYAEENELLPSVKLRGDPNLSVYERIAEEPSISFPNGHWGVPNGGNSIQEKACCQIGVRITAGQDPKQVEKALRDYLLSQDVAGAEISLRLEENCFAWKGDLSRPFTQKYLAALGENFKESHILPTGGALPFLREFQKLFPKMELIIPGVEDPKTFAHSHNESQDIGVLERAINTLISFIEKMHS